MFCREGTGWEVEEYCEPIADMRHNLDQEFYFPETGVEVMALAHKYASQDYELGFSMYDDRVRPDPPPEEANEYEASIASDPVPEEPPLAKDEGEPLESDRVVPFKEDHEIVVDGVTMNMDCNLKTLQAGCTSLGLSGRGGKAKCLKRMVDHLRAQALITAHGATVKLRAEDKTRAVKRQRNVCRSCYSMARFFIFLQTTALFYK